MELRENLREELRRLLLRVNRVCFSPTSEQEIAATAAVVDESKWATAGGDVEAYGAMMRACLQQQRDKLDVLDCARLARVAAAAAAAATPPTKRARTTHTLRSDMIRASAAARVGTGVGNGEREVIFVE